MRLLAVLLLAGACRAPSRAGPRPVDEVVDAACAAQSCLEPAGPVAVAGRLEAIATLCTAVVCAPGSCCSACGGAPVLRGAKRSILLHMPGVRCGGTNCGVTCTGAEMGARYEVRGTLRVAAQGRGAAPSDGTPLAGGRWAELTLDVDSQRRAGTPAAPAGDAAALSDALALVHTAGCTDVRQCKVAPVGAKACGGPTSYAIYCAATTDEKQLLDKLGAHARAERARLAATGEVSDCAYLPPPAVKLEGGECKRGP